MPSRASEVIFDSEILDHIAKIFDEKGADAWWSMSIDELLPNGCKFKADELEKVSDILDVWFDSGSTWNAVLNSGDYDAGEYSANMYLEGSDQHRGWFQSSLLLSCAVNEKAPYKSVLTHGFTVDKNGEKMSKSKGNVIAPDAVAKEFGVEILRLWVSLSDYSRDLKIGNDILKQVAEQYRKIRNTIRFLLANISDLKEFNYEFGLLDRWILGKASACFNEVSSCFKNYEYSKGFNILLNFLSGDLSGIYLDICKDRLYCDAANSAKRASSQTAMALITKALLPLIAPTLTYTVDEVMEYAPSIIKDGKSDVFDLVYEPIKFDSVIDDTLLKESKEKFNEIIDNLKKDKLIKATLELEIQTSSDSILALAKDEVADWYMVSNFGVFRVDSDILAEFVVGDNRFVVARSAKFKCPRCWKFSAQSDECLCPRCAEVMSAN